MRRLITFAATIAGLAVCIPTAMSQTPTAISWQKTVLDTKFRSEGVSVADVNKDGKLDVLNGEYWYEAPNWTPHEMQPPVDHKDGLGNYSRVFACWAEDLNADGYADLIVIDFPGAPCYWLENPQGKTPHWRRHTIWHSACNETPLYTDLLGTGKRVLIMGSQPKGKETEGQMAYFSPAKDPYALWEMHAISEPSVPAIIKDGKPVAGTGKEIPGTRKFSHGLGVGDLNNDGKNDVICTGGWWEQPESHSSGTAWKFHPANLGDACADMFAYDVDGDGKTDVLSTSAHRFGIWWHMQRGDAKTKSDFVAMPLFPMLTSETHAAHFVDIDGDGQKDLVTGKRWWSHGRSEPGSAWAAQIYWFKAVKNRDKITSFTPMLIDADSGIGTQFEITDLNGDGHLDIISSNKKGVRIIVQVRK